jgi:hypothetical protein
MTRIPRSSEETGHPPPAQHRPPQRRADSDQHAALIEDGEGVPVGAAVVQVTVGAVEGRL